MTNRNQEFADYLKAHREVRVSYSHYYERLALIDGGTIALAVNAVLGNAHDQFRHKYTLAFGLALLVVAVVALLLRNLHESRREAVLTDQQYYLMLGRDDLAEQRQARIDGIGKRTAPLERIGVYCTVGGMVVLGAVLVLLFV